MPEGNPDSSVKIYSTASSLSPPTGSASISQTFGCGGSFDPGSCVISFDVLLGAFGATARLTVLVDGGEAYSETFNTSSPWKNVEIHEPCGLHTLEIEGQYVGGNAATSWAIHVDNVTGTCMLPNSVEPSIGTSTWGRAKGRYR